MSAAINLTEGEEFLRPSANFWSGEKELEKELLCTVQCPVTHQNDFQLSLRIHTHT